MSYDTILKEHYVNKQKDVQNLVLQQNALM